jgi:hypothetical protein
VSDTAHYEPVCLFICHLQDIALVGVGQPHGFTKANQTRCEISSMNINKTCGSRCVAVRGPKNEQIIPLAFPMQRWLTPSCWNREHHCLDRPRLPLEFVDDTSPKTRDTMFAQYYPRNRRIAFRLENRTGSQLPSGNRSHRAKTTPCLNSVTIFNELFAKVNNGVVIGTGSVPRTVRILRSSHAVR